MAKKRASSAGGQNVSKRMRAGEKSFENDSDMSDMSAESDGEQNCSQNPDFRPQEPNVSYILCRNDLC